MKLRVFITFALIVLACANASAQQFVALTASDGSSVAVSSGASAKRVGKGVLIQVHLRSSPTNWGWTNQVLAACDGSWLSGTIQAAIHEPSIEFPNGYPGDSMEINLAPQLEAVPLFKGENVDLPYWKSLRTALPALCKSAGEVDKRQLLTVAETTVKLGRGNATSLLVGTAVRKGRQIDVWERVTSFVEEPVIFNGVAMSFGDKPHMKRKATERYTLLRFTFDCERNSSAVYNMAEYDDKGSSPRITSLPKERANFAETIPGSVGETVLETVCQIF